MFLPESWVLRGNLLPLSNPGPDVFSRGLYSWSCLAKSLKNIFSSFYKLLVPKEQENWMVPQTARFCVFLDVFKGWWVLWKELISWIMKINACWLYQKVPFAPLFTIPGNKELAPDYPADLWAVVTAASQENGQRRESQGLRTRLPEACRSSAYTQPASMPGKPEVQLQAEAYQGEQQQLC